MRIITIISLKNGVGKSTVALNLAFLLKKNGFNTLLIDSDINTANLHDHLHLPNVGLQNLMNKHLNQANLNQANLNAQHSIPQNFTISDLNSQNPVSLQEHFHESIRDLIHKTEHGFHVISSRNMPFHTSTNSYGTHLGVHLAQLNDYEYVIIDSPTHAELLNELLSSIHSLHFDISTNEGIIVHSPYHSSKYVLDAANLLKKHNITNLGVFLNMTQPHSANAVLEYPIIGTMPYHIHVVNSRLERVPFMSKKSINHLMPFSTSVHNSFNHFVKKLM